MACVGTYCGLCIYSTTLDPIDISTKLGIQPSRIRTKDPSSRYRPRRERSFWVRSTEERLASSDYRDHLQSIFDDLEGKGPVLVELRDAGCEMRISCFLDVASNVEIWLDRQAIRTLASLGLEIWWDVYGARNEAPDDADESGASGQGPVP